MGYVIGIVLALAVTASATALGFDRERVFYPSMMITIAAYYILFAAMGATAPVVIVELVAAAAFMVLAVTGFKTSLWLVAAALAAHGMFDPPRRCLQEHDATGIRRDEPITLRTSLCLCARAGTAALWTAAASPGRRGSLAAALAARSRALNTTAVAGIFFVHDDSPEVVVGNRSAV